MEVVVHLLLFLLSAGVIWFFAGLLVDDVDRLAKRYNQSGFTVAFFVLGVLTSIGEISVMVNSTINGVPQVSAGNLVGASFVILLFIVPLLAIVGRGVALKKNLSKQDLLITLLAVLLPALLMLDSAVTPGEGLICLLVYGTMLYLIRRHTPPSVPQIVEDVGEELVNKTRATAVDGVKIAGGALFIFLAGHQLVTEAVYFSDLLSVPKSVIGLLLLSVGTNVPEIVIAMRSVLKKRKDIAFGNYIGSTLANTATFGVLALFNGAFVIEAGEFILTAGLMATGFGFFYFFAKSRSTISRKEGMVLISFYGLFVAVQVVTLILFALRG